MFYRGVLQMWLFVWLLILRPPSLPRWSTGISNGQIEKLPAVVIWMIANTQAPYFTKVTPQGSQMVKMKGYGYSYDCLLHKTLSLYRMICYARYASTLPTWFLNQTGFMFNGGLMFNMWAFLPFFKYGAQACELEDKIGNMWSNVILCNKAWWEL